MGHIWGKAPLGRKGRGNSDPGKEDQEVGSGGRAADAKSKDVGGSVVLKEVFNSVPEGTLYREARPAREVNREENVGEGGV